MKKRRLRPSLLSVLLCAIIAILFVKLAVIVAGNFVLTEVVSPTRDEAIAGQEKTARNSGAEPDKSGTSLVSESFASTPPADKSVKNTKSAQAANPAEALTFIQQRENELRKKEEQLKEKEERLSKIEKEVEQKTKELLSIQKEIQSFRTERQDVQNTKIKGLAKIYGTMKPKEAAKLLENLDDKLVMGIISTMTSDEAASILSIMEVKKAAKISEALSGR